MELVRYFSGGFDANLPNSNISFCKINNGDGTCTCTTYDELGNVVNIEVVQTENEESVEATPEERIAQLEELVAQLISAQ